MPKTNEQITAERATYKDAVRRHGHTLTSIAKEMGITLPALPSMLTRGVSAGLAARTAAVLGCSPSDLLPDGANDAHGKANGQKVTFTFVCPDCGKAHTLSISID